MLTIKQQNLVTFAVKLGEAINNYADCDVIAQAINLLKAVDEYSNVQQVYDNIHYLIAAVEYRKGHNQRLRDQADSFACTMSMLEHIKGKNGEAIEHIEAKANQGDIIRIM